MSVYKLTDKEDKDLLLKDLCARLPYGVKAHIEHDTFYDEIEPYDGTVNTNTINDLLHNEKLEVRPYLRPLSSMSEEERKECNKLRLAGGMAINVADYCDWLNAHHFDYRGLIPKGLALAAPEGMYN